MVQCINKAAIELGLSLLCLAPTGIAAGNLPGGKTIHSAFNFPIAMKTGEFMRDMTTDQLNRIRHQMDLTTIALVVIDEISFIGPEMLAQIDNRLRQLLSKPEIPYGGLSVALCGDFFQLSPVKAKSLFSSTWRHFGLGQRIDQDGLETPLERGILLFSKLQKFELDQQMRAAEDESQIKMLDQMRFPQPGQTRVDKRKILSYRTISSDDFKQDPAWLNASLVVTSNKERFLVNFLRSKHWSIQSGNPRFKWKYPLCGSAASKTPTPAHNYIYTNFPGKVMVFGMSVFYLIIYFFVEKNLADALLLGHQDF